MCCSKETDFEYCVPELAAKIAYLFAVDSYPRGELVLVSVLGIVENIGNMASILDAIRLDLATIFALGHEKPVPDC